jgi:hypothetical protein
MAQRWSGKLESMRARHMPIAAPASALLVAALALGGCGSSTQKSNGAGGVPAGGQNAGGSSANGGASGGADVGQAGSAGSGGGTDAGTAGAAGAGGNAGCTPSPTLTYKNGVPLDCAAKPSACCYPDDTNTGVPPGTSLKASGSFEVQTDGAVVSALDVTGTIDVYANNVIIENTRVTTASSGSYAVAIRPGMTGTVIRDTTIRGQDNDTNSVEYAIFNISGNPVSVERVNLYNCSECIIGGDVTVVDSYIHDTADPSGAHVEDIYGQANTVLRHDTMFNAVDQTAVVYLDPGQGVGYDCHCTVTDSLLAGGGYTIYGGSSSTQDSSDVVITNNRFARTYHQNSGYYGLDAYFNANGQGDSWSGNYWDDTAAVAGP